MSLKNLPLNRSLIENAISNYNQNLEYTWTPSGANKFICKVTIPGEKKAIINVFYCASGKTTLQVNQGANPDLSKQIADHIVELCSVVVASREVLSIKGLDSDDFDLLLEYLKDDCNSIVVESDIPHGKKYQVNGCQGDNITLTYYSNKTFLMQGCPVLLHSQIIEFLSNILEFSELIQSQLNLIPVKLKPSIVLDEMSGLMPLSFTHLDNTVKVLISPSIALCKLEIDLEDYSVMAFPALRGLEAYIKYLFRSKSITIGRNGFAPHLNDSYHATLSESARDLIGCANTCTAINQCYSYYKNQRHGLFHTNGILANTRILTNRQEAVDVVNGALQCIENASNLIRG